MFLFNVGAVIITSVGFVSVESVPQINRLIDIFRQFVPRIRCLRLRRHLCHIKHHGVFNFP